jgi:glycosyltransferase involved in cell wall biosynthesis
VSRRIRLGVFASHPIQYQAPIWRRLARSPGVDLLVHYFSDLSVRGGIDPGFGVRVAWDQPLLDGYEHVFLARGANLDRPLTVTIPHLGAYLRARNFDALFVNGYEYAFELQLRRFGAPLIMRPELTASPPGAWPRRGPRALFGRWFYEGVSAFCVIGEQARRSLLASGVPPEKMFFSPYAVDSELFEASADSVDRESSRRLLGIPAGRFVLLFSGKLIPRKNPALVLDALEPGMIFVVLGDGPDRASLEQKAARLPGAEVRFAGFQNQSQLAPYFKAADALVLPSLQETWGLVVNEAMHFGLPVVVSDAVGCAADLVRETGLIFRSNDAVDLARALRMLAGDDRLRRRFGRNARRVIGGYSSDLAARGIVEALDYCCENGRACVDRVITGNSSWWGRRFRLPPANLEAFFHSLLGG